ncbi:MAG: phytoene desaturase family protein [Actinomycetota bacterium]|nr:phytoene desaturase family protein [Actinomycetota bacterium]
MRTVPGRTDKVVVVGAGLAGLSATLRLLAAGREVTVLERDDNPGGRSGLLADSGYRFDTGPTVLTMPEFIDDALGCVGEHTQDWLDLVEVDPVYRAHFPDGSTLDVRSDADTMADEVARACGPDEAAGYRRYVEFVSGIYRAERNDFIDRNLDSPLDLLTPNLARLVAAGGLRRLAPKVGQYLRDPRMQRVMSFQSLYAGLSPFEALAIYAVISYMDSVSGVVFPRGGMHELPRALAGAAAKHGATLRYGVTVAGVLVSHGRAVGVETESGERIDADVVVLNPDLPIAYRDLLPPAATPRRVRALRPSPSCLLVLVGSRQGYPGAAHHNIHFGRAWREVFQELVVEGQLMSDPSLLVTYPSATDPGLAPPGRHLYSVLAPTPDMRAGLDWSVLGQRYRDECLARLEGMGYPGFQAAVEIEHVVTPADWQRRGMAHGTPFASAHLLRQSGPFRPANLAPHVGGVVFAGSGTQPGVGVPMCLLSGRLAAERIVGPS